MQCCELCVGAISIIAEGFAGNHMDHATGVLLYVLGQRIARCVQVFTRLLK